MKERAARELTTTVISRPAAEQVYQHVKGAFPSARPCLAAKRSTPACSEPAGAETEGGPFVDAASAPLLYQRGLRARTRERRRWEVPVGASSLNTEVLCGVALLDPCRPTAGLLSVRAMQPCHLPQHSAQRALHHRDLRECVARVQRCTSALWTLGHSWARSRSASAARGAVPPRCSIAAALSSGVSVRRGWA